MSDFTDFFPTAGTTSGGGGGGTIVVGSNTYPAPLPSASLAMASVYESDGYNKFKEYTFDPQYSAQPLTNGATSVPAATYTIVDLDNTDFPNGGAFLQTTCYFKVQQGSEYSWSLTNPELIVTIDGVATSYKRSTWSGTGTNSKSLTYVIGSQPFDIYAARDVGSNSTSYAVSWSTINSRPTGNSGVVLGTNKNLAVYGDLATQLQLGLTNTYMSPRSIVSKQWMGAGLPWLRWTTDLKIELKHGGYSATNQYATLSALGVLKHMGL